MKKRFFTCSAGRLGLFALAVLGLGISQVADATNVRISPQSERFYRQALPDLDQAEQMLNRSVRLRKAGIPEAWLVSDGKTFAALTAKALPPLRQSATMGHPVAQYRLAGFFQRNVPTPEARKFACQMFQASLLQGFAPAAAAISQGCPDLERDPGFSKMAEAALHNDVAYQKYYPVPTAFFACRLVEETRENRYLNHRLGNANDYRAEIDFLVGGIVVPGQDPTERSKISSVYYQNAVNENDCPAAKRRLETQKRIDGAS